MALIMLTLSARDTSVSPKLSPHLYLTFLSHSPLNTCYVHSEQFCLGSLRKTQGESVEWLFPCLGDSTLPWQPPTTPCSEVREGRAEVVCCSGSNTWPWGAPLYTEVSSLQGVGIEGFHCIQRCTHFGCWNRGVPLYTEVSSLQGVGIEGFHCIQRCPHFRVLE